MYLAEIIPISLFSHKKAQRAPKTKERLIVLFELGSN